MGYSTYSYDSLGPQAFRIGDIVEAQLSIVVIPMKGGKYKMLSVLRALTMLEEGQMQVSVRQMIQGQ